MIMKDRLGKEEGTGNLGGGFKFCEFEKKKKEKKRKFEALDGFIAGWLTG